MKVDVQRLEIVLAEKRMTKTDLSAKSGVSRQNLSAIFKRGTCEPKTAGKLAAGLGVALAELLEVRT